MRIVLRTSDCRKQTLLSSNHSSLLHKHLINKLHELISMFPPLYLIQDKNILIDIVFL